MVQLDATAKLPFLSIQSLIKKFDEAYAVDNVSLDIVQGEIFALLGSSGCGKSTLLRMLAGFEKPTSGKILLQGQDLTAFAPNERPVNMMFQSYALFPHLSVWDNVAFGLRRDGLPKDEISTKVEQMLSLVQLQTFAKRKPHQLSGGQQQRVALAWLVDGVIGVARLGGRCGVIPVGRASGDGVCDPWVDRMGSVSAGPARGGFAAGAPKQAG